MGLRTEWVTDRYVRLWDGDRKLIALGGDAGMDRAAILTAALKRLAAQSGTAVDHAGVTVMPNGDVVIRVPVATAEGA